MISTLTLAARLALAAVFAVAGIAKLGDREGTRNAVVGFGAPERFAGPLAFLLPLAELTAAGLLLPATTAAAGAVAALLLLALFSGAIAWSLARGRTPDCHCFGQLHSAPASRKTLARNCALSGLAVFVVAGSVVEPDASGVAWIRRLDGAELLALGTVAAAAALLAVGAVAFGSLLRSYGNVLVRLEKVEAALAEAGIDLGESTEIPEIGLEPGTPAPPFWTQSLTAETVSLETLRESGLPTLLLFTSPHCGPCEALLPVAAGWQREHAERFNVVFASEGTAAEVGAEAEKHGLDHVLLDVSRELYQSYEANGTPSAVLIAPDGTIASWVASGSDWIEQLVTRVLERDDGEQGLPLGTEAPALELPSLAGEPVSLASLRGRATLLLFWNPDCGFCRSMHEDLTAWETSANGVTPRLVIVSSGDAESTSAEGFRSLVLLDEEFSAGSVFEAGGTPMAVLLDADGRIASGVAAGAEAVLALAGSELVHP